nr:MAG TPA: hypothetical protein [Caudoviricetes sp.]
MIMPVVLVTLWCCFWLYPKSPHTPAKGYISKLSVSRWIKLLVLIHQYT